MDWFVAALAAVGGFVVCAAAVTQQYRLYREPDYREHPLAGRRLRVYQVLAGVAGGSAWALAAHVGANWLGTACLFLFAVILVVLASTDFERRRLPNRLMYPAIVLAAALSWAWP